MPVVIFLAVVTGVCMWGFRFVEQSFFPNSTTPIFYVDMRLPLRLRYSRGRREDQWCEKFCSRKMV